MSLFIILFAVIGAGIGYVFATQTRSNAVTPVMGAALGGIGGLIGGVLVRAIFPIMLGLIGAVVGALVLLWAYKRFGKR